LSSHNYKDPFGLLGPISRAFVHNAGTTVVTGGGENLAIAFQSTSKPNPVEVVLTLGATHYCMSFDGTVLFSPTTLTYKAASASAPVACPPPRPPSP
jgi:hypothetical protein